ncbi:MAG: hypothetical protein O3B24_00965 [Verrucomicrobia bacterium]|nr:hypothetical protein [Verrucomicrobiota bacterium]
MKAILGLMVCMLGSVALSFAEEAPDIAPEAGAARIAEALKEKNVGLYPIGEKRFVATWIDPSLAPEAPSQGAALSRASARAGDRFFARCDWQAAVIADGVALNPRRVDRAGRHAVAR